MSLYLFHSGVRKYRHNCEVKVKFYILAGCNHKISPEGGEIERKNLFSYQIYLQCNVQNSGRRIIYIYIPNILNKFYSFLFCFTLFEQSRILINVTLLSSWWGQKSIKSFCQIHTIYVSRSINAPQVLSS